MDQGRGLWDLLFGVSDPDQKSQIKLEDKKKLQMDLSDDFLALLSDPLLMECQKEICPLPVNDLMDMIPDIDFSNYSDLDLEALGDLSAYLQVSSSNISSSGSDDGDGSSSSSESISREASPKCIHSTTSDGNKEELLLSREEMILLKKEGLALPKCYPLSKQEERTLKKIRRKIRNKKSAQESRRKKKVYMDTLEDQVKDVQTQNKTLQKRVKELEKENVSLQQQLKTLQNIFGRATRNTKATGTCLMALVLSVALIVSPYTQNNASEAEKDLVLVGDYQVQNVAPVRSRTIMYNLDGPPEARLFGIPLAKEGLRLSQEEQLSLSSLKSNSNKVPDQAWELRHVPAENISVTLSQKNLTTAPF